MRHYHQARWNEPERGRRDVIGIAERDRDDPRKRGQDRDGYRRGSGILAHD